MPTSTWAKATDDKPTPRPATSVIANLRLREMLIIFLVMRNVEQVNARARQGRLIAVVVVVMPVIVVAAFGHKDATAQRASETNGQQY